jgi:hypothetical protein
MIRAAGVGNPSGSKSEVSKVSEAAFEGSQLANQPDGYSEGDSGGIPLLGGHDASSRSSGSGRGSGRGSGSPDGKRGSSKFTGKAAVVQWINRALKLNFVEVSP